ncbi:unnamed protein product [Echinostoma caproni]|uniref:SCP domain-containing protein n=1 Tax=Echinostoma caproni TaxID=27848 RepID=A0A183ANQ3_9TREM|nr:unnamed protein product [Echinostoma caproni]
MEQNEKLSDRQYCFRSQRSTGDLLALISHTWSAALGNHEETHKVSFDDDKAELLLLHNVYRAKLLNCTVPGQPPAAQMPKMTWNDKLAEKAQTWSDKCKVGHDKKQDRLVAPFRWVGQNFAGNPSVENGFYAWFDEHKNYDYANNNCTKVCGHYTQVLGDICPNQAVGGPGIYQAGYGSVLECQWCGEGRRVGRS